MDAEHRHELKTNELAEWAQNLPETIKKNRNQIIGVIFIVAAVLSFFFFRGQSRKTANEQQVDTTNKIHAIAQNKLNVVMDIMSDKVPATAAFSNIAGELELAANEAEEPTQSAMALIKMAEALRAELHYTTADVDQEKIDANIEKAEQAYEAALIKAKGDATLSAMATYGLGLCAEETGDFNKAAEIFKGITENQQFAGTIFTAQAQFRLDIMDDNKEKFTFVKAPPAKTIPGFDKNAMDAVMRGDIVIDSDKEKPKTETAPKVTPTPDTEAKTDTEAKPDAEVKPDTETKPDAEAKPDTTDTEKVYDVGPIPPAGTGTEQK